MAGVFFIVRPGELANHTAAKTLVQIVAPTNQRILVHEGSISFKGTVNTDAPVLVRILRQTTAGTPGGDGGALTLTKYNSVDDEIIQSTAQKGPSTNAAWTTEPTAGDIILEEEVHQQTGFLWQPPWRMPPIQVPGGTRLGIQVTASVNYNCSCRLLCEE